MTRYFYTDGSCSGNGTEKSYGAWGFIEVQNDKEVYRYSHAEKNTTNQRQELFAILNACVYAQFTGSINDKVIIYSDSAYAVNCYNQRWYLRWQKNGWKNSKKEPVANKDIWECLIPFYDNPNFSFEKVKGHAGVQWNEEVDNMVQTATRRLKEKDGI